jgi:hypothetical protein
MRIKKSKRAEIEAQHAEAAELLAQHKRWLQYCDDLRTGKIERKLPKFAGVAMALATGAGTYPVLSSPRPRLRR